MSPVEQRLRTPARVLLLIDQLALVDLIKLAFHDHQYSTRVARTGGEAAAILAWRPHLIILRMDSSDGAGMDGLVRKVKEAGQLPVIALTHEGDLKTRLAAFGAGVDDILSIPFCPEEFVARVVAVMRRTYREALAFTPVLRLGDLEIDILNRRVRAGGKDLHVTSLEQSLLYLLAVNAGRLLTRDEILDHLWGGDYVAQSNIVDRHIRNLRSKLQNDSGRPRYIVTVPGRGYRFDALSAAATSSP
jgi:DNA-binding response OmpR family regulator